MEFKDWLDLNEILDSPLPTPHGGTKSQHHLNLQIRERLVEVQVNPTKQQLVNWLKNSGELKGMVLKGETYVWDVNSYAWHEDILNKLGVIRGLDYPNNSDKFFVTIRNGNPIVSSYTGNIGEKVRKWAGEVGMTVT